MKTLALKSILIAGLSLFFVLPAISQKGIEDGSKYGKGQDSINCIKNLSLYKEFYKHNNYADAIGPWRVVFSECPASSENVYVHGVSMYRKYIGEASGDRQKELIDTLMLVYSRRIEYFPKNKGSILGRKGTDLLRYSRDDIDALEEGYGYLKQSIEIEKTKSRDAIMVTFINASITLNNAGVVDDNQVIEDYFMVTEIVDQLLAKSSRWPKAKASIDDLMLKSGLLTCDALNRYYEPQFEGSKNDKEFLEKLIDFYSQSGCDRSDLYVAASEQMYELEPGPKSAHQLAVMFMRKEDYSKASLYLGEAVQGADIDNDTKAEWYYELAMVKRASEDYCTAIKHAKAAIALKSDLGKALLLLGDCYIFARNGLGDDFEKRTAYWAAADKYAKAKQVDPSTTSDANKRISDYATQYPNHEEVFFRDMKDGDSYNVKGCINEYTTVRSRK